MQLKRSTPTSFTLSLFTLIIAVSMGFPAVAGCTDPARPGVEWKGCYHSGRPFGNVDISGADLRQANLARTDLSGANMVNADARRAKLFSAKMAGANLNGANLADADLTKSDLTNASLVGANLHTARLFRAILRGADLTNAKLDGADLLNADLSGATWVDGKTICSDASISRCN